MNKFIKKTAIFFCALLLMQNVSNAEVLEFAQVSDVHYSLEDKDMDRQLYFLSLSLKKRQPEFLMFLGDNVDKSREEDVIGFMRAIYGIRTPYYLVLGKRDAHRISGIEKEVYLDIVSAFNKNQNSDEKYYYFKPNSDFICVVLDDSSDFVPSSHGEIPEEQIKWLENLLIKYPKKLFLIFHHTPILEPRVEYKKTMLNADNYKALIKKYPNIISISSGHYHQSSMQIDENGIRHISAPAFKDMPHSYQLIQVMYDKDSYKSPKDIQVTVTNVKI